MSARIWKRPPRYLAQGMHEMSTGMDQITVTVNRVDTI
jgi:hypothetical protein